MLQRTNWLSYEEKRTSFSYGTQDLYRIIIPIIKNKYLFYIGPTFNSLLTGLASSENVQIFLII